MYKNIINFGSNNRLYLYLAENNFQNVETIFDNAFSRIDQNIDLIENNFKDLLSKNLLMNNYERDPAYVSNFKYGITFFTLFNKTMKYEKQISDVEKEANVLINNFKKALDNNCLLVYFVRNHIDYYAIKNHTSKIDDFLNKHKADLILLCAKKELAEDLKYRSFVVDKPEETNCVECKALIKYLDENYDKVQKKKNSENSSSLLYSSSVKYIEAHNKSINQVLFFNDKSQYDTLHLYWVAQQFEIENIVRITPHPSNENFYIVETDYIKYLLQKDNLSNANKYDNSSSLEPQIINEIRGLSNGDKDELLFKERIPTLDKKYYVKTEFEEKNKYFEKEGGYYSMSTYNEDDVTLDKLDNKAQVYSSGVAFGKLYLLLKQIKPLQKFNIKNTSTPTKNDLDTLIRVVKENKYNREEKDGEYVIKEFKELQEKVILDFDKIEAFYPVITSFDVSNLIFDKKGKKCIGFNKLPSLETGTLYDMYGPAVNACCNGFDIKLYKEFTEGFIDGLNKASLSQEEINALYLSPLQYNLKVYVDRMITEFTSKDESKYLTSYGRSILMSNLHHAKMGILSKDIEKILKKLTKKMK